MAAHIGGLIAGFACGLILSQPLSEKMVARRRFRNFAIAATGSIALLVSIVCLHKMPAISLPACTSPEVATVLSKVIRSNPGSATVTTIDGYRELSYDSELNVRYGECVAHTDAGAIPMKFVVEWQDERKGLFQVRVLPSGLPACTSPEVTQVLDQVIRSNPGTATVTMIDGYREVRYDPELNERFGECVAHTDAGDTRVKFLVEWQDEEKGLFQVRLLSSELPACTGPEVAEVLGQVMRDNLGNGTLRMIDGYRELRYDPELDVRYGECMAHTNHGDIRVIFLVEWEDKDRGIFQVRIIPGVEGA